MNRRIIGLCVPAAILASVAFAGRSEGRDLVAAFTLGVIAVPELSGAACVDGKLVLASDEDSEVYTLSDLSKLYQGRVGLGDDFKLSTYTTDFVDKLDDMEEVVWDHSKTSGPLLFLSSSSRSRKGKDSKKRFSVGMVTVQDGQLPASAPAPSEVKFAFPGTVSNYYLDLDGSRLRTPAQAGFNIEGATFKDSHLLLGLRSPTATYTLDRLEAEKEISNEEAVVLEVDSPFPVGTWNVSKIHVLKLDGAGIRGLCYDKEALGTWILAGISPDVEDHLTNTTWSLWFWPDGGAAIQKINSNMELGLANAEAICILPASAGKPRALFIAEDRKIDKINSQTWTRFVIVPINGAQIVE